MDQVFDGSRSDIRLGLSDGLVDPDAQPPSAKALFIQRRINQMTEDQLSVFYDRIIDLLDDFSQPSSINGHSSTPYALGIIFHRTQSPQND